MKIERKLRHASQTTIFSSLRQVISGLTSGHGSAPGNCRKITRFAAPICGAAIPRPYPVAARQCASVSAKSPTSERISSELGSATRAATSRNPGSPSCKTVRTATRASPLLAALSLFRPFPPARICCFEYRLDHRHIFDGVLERHRNVPLAPHGSRKLVTLNRILVDNRKLFNLWRSAHHAPYKNPARPIIRRVPRNFDFDAP